MAAGAGEGSEVYVVGAQARLGHLLVEYRGMVPPNVLAVRLMHFYLSAQPEQTVS